MCVRQEVCYRDVLKHIRRPVAGIFMIGYLEVVLAVVVVADDVEVVEVVVDTDVDSAPKLLDEIDNKTIVALRSDDQQNK